MQIISLQWARGAIRRGLSGTNHLSKSGIEGVAISSGALRLCIINTVRWRKATLYPNNAPANPAASFLIVINSVCAPRLR